MKKTYTLENTHNYLYSHCSRNVAEKIQNHKNSIIYPTHYKILSNICTNRRTKDNPYLMTDGALEAIIYYFKYYDNGSHTCSKQDILFCQKDEMDAYFQGLFSNLIMDLYIEGNKVVNQALSEYIPLSENSAYKYLIDKYAIPETDYNKYGIPQKLFNEKDLINNAISYLYFSNNDIDIIFMEFIDQTKSFKKLDTQIETFINEKLLPNLYLYNDSHFDGIITKQILELRLSKIISLINFTQEYDDCLFEQNHYYSFFAKDLEYIHARSELQKRLIGHNF